MRLWLILGIVTNALVLLLAIGGSYALSLHIISERQQVWCPLLTDLTSKPPPRAAPPADRRQFGELVSVRNRWC